MPRNANLRQGRSGGSRFDALALCSLLIAGAAVLAGIAWTHPTTTSAVATYRQSGAFSYSAPAAATSIYGAGGVQTGQPVYQQVVTTLQLKYSYRFLTSSHAVLRGTEQLMAVVNEQQGLTKTVPLQAPTSFKGTTFTTTASLSLANLQRLIAAYQSFNKNSGATFTVAILPNVTVDGQLASTAFRAAFDPATKFTFDGSLFMPTPGSGGHNTAATDGKSGQPIVSATSGSLSIDTARAATLVGSITVNDARIASLAFLAVLLGVAGVLGWPLLKDATSSDEHVRIAIKLSRNIVEVSSLPRSPGTTVELASLDGLEQVGRQLECPVLHLRGDAGDEYAVVDNGTVYSYRIVGQPEQRLGHLVSANPDSPRHATASRGSAGNRARSS